MDARLEQFQNITKEIEATFSQRMLDNYLLNISLKTLCDDLLQFLRLLWTLLETAMLRQLDVF